MISKLIAELETYLSSSAGFVVRDTLERLHLQPPLVNNKDKKLLVDVICDEVLNLSVAKTSILKSKFYALFDITSYTDDLEYWR